MHEAVCAGHPKHIKALIGGGMRSLGDDMAQQTSLRRSPSRQPSAERAISVARAATNTQGEKRYAWEEPSARWDRWASSRTYARGDCLPSRASRKPSKGRRGEEETGEGGE